MQWDREVSRGIWRCFQAALEPRDVQGPAKTWWANFLWQQPGPGNGRQKCSRSGVQLGGFKHKCKWVGVVMGDTGQT